MGKFIVDTIVDRSIYVKAILYNNFMNFFY